MVADGSYMVSIYSCYMVSVGFYIVFIWFCKVYIYIYIYIYI